jgi:hypothetical protein
MTRIHTPWMTRTFLVFGWLAAFALGWPRASLGEPDSERKRQRSAHPAPSTRAHGAMKHEPLLQSSVRKVPNGIVVDYSVDAGDYPILVFNRLRSIASPGSADAERVYRFVVGKSLRLLLGEAPLGPGMQVHARNRPQAVKVERFGRIEDSIQIRTPVTEHSSYFEHAAAGSETPDEVQDVTLFVEIVDARAIKLDRSQLFPDAFQTGPIALGQIQTLRGNTQPMPLPVVRRTDRFARLLQGNERDPVDWMKPIPFPMDPP